MISEERINYLLNKWKNVVDCTGLPPTATLLESKEYWTDNLKKSILVEPFTSEDAERIKNENV
jgi:hypothetical protein